MTRDTMHDDAGRAEAEATGRRAYEKPKLRSFPLMAEEVLAKGCKMGTPSAGFQLPGCPQAGCFTLGS